MKYKEKVGDIEMTLTLNSNLEKFNADFKDTIALTEKYKKLLNQMPSCNNCGGCCDNPNCPYSVKRCPHGYTYPSERFYPYYVQPYTWCGTSVTC